MPALQQYECVSIHIVIHASELDSKTLAKKHDKSLTKIMKEYGDPVKTTIKKNGKDVPIKQPSRKEERNSFYLTFWFGHAHNYDHPHCDSVHSRTAMIVTCMKCGQWS